MGHSKSRRNEIFNTPYNKIASAMATNWDFVNNVASEKPTFASTGMMEIEQIDKLVDIFENFNVLILMLQLVLTLLQKAI